MRLYWPEDPGVLFVRQLCFQASFRINSGGGLWYGVALGAVRLVFFPKPYTMLKFPHFYFHCMIWILSRAMRAFSSGGLCLGFRVGLKGLRSPL